jgi:hypothetical protein
VEIRNVIVEAHESFGETDHDVAFKGPKNLASGVVGDDVRNMGFGVEFGVGPHFACNLDTQMEVVKGVERTNGDIGGHKSFVVRNKLSERREEKKLDSAKGGEEIIYFEGVVLDV